MNEADTWTLIIDILPVFREYYQRTIIAVFADTEASWQNKYRVYNISMSTI